MSNWTVHLEFEEGTSSKFWRARVEGSTLYVNYGKIGAAGQTQVKDFGTADNANKEYDKLIREKRKKGYVDAGTGGGSAPTDNDEDDVNDDVEDDDEDEDSPAPRPARAAVPNPPPAAAAPAARPPGSVRLLLESGNRKVETWVSLDGKTVRMDSTETYATPEAAKKAQERLKKMLLAEGYKQG